MLHLYYHVYNGLDLSCRRIVRWRDIGFTLQVIWSRVSALYH